VSAKQNQILKLCHEISRQYHNDFDGWVNRFISFTGLSFSGLTFQQKEIGETLIEEKNVCVSAGGGIGKTAVAALLCIWFLSTHPFARIPKQPQQVNN
jgi:Lhr-like helicase